MISALNLTSSSGAVSIHSCLVSCISDLVSFSSSQIGIKLWFLKKLLEMIEIVNDHSEFQTVKNTLSILQTRTW
jgi:hypothetical protein